MNDMPLDVSRAGATRLAARAIEGNLLYGARRVWGWWRLPLNHLDYLTHAEQEQEAYAAASAWEGLAGYDVHVLTASVPSDPDAWAQRLTADAYAPRAGWDEGTASAVAHMKARGDMAKTVYVGVDLGERKSSLLGKRTGAAFGMLEQLGGVPDHVIPTRELERWRTKAHKVGRPLTDGTFGARPASADELAWLIAHSVRRNQPMSLPNGTARWGPGQLAWLVDGELHHTRRHVRATGQDGAETFHTVLTVARMPETMTWPPGAPWLCLHEWLHEHVEVSARWKIVGHRAARRDVAARIAAARGQTEHAAEAGAHMPIRDQERVWRATDLEARLDRERTALAYANTRLVVTADSESALDAIADEVIEQYRHADIELARPSWDQLSMMMEAVPGDRVRVHAYRQVHDLETLGGAMPTASAALGDGIGHYLGYTTGRLAEQPVHYSPWEAVRRKDQQREATVAITGTLGGGKSVTFTSIVEAGHRAGARCVLFDPKGDMGRLSMLPGADVDVIDLTTAPDGILDPWSLVDDPDQAKMVALEVIDRLVAGRAEPQHRTAIDQAVEAVSQSRNPTLSAVVDRLEQGDKDAQRIGSSLAMYRTMPLARLAFRPPSGPLPLGDGITVITTPGIEYPRPGTPLADMSWAQRLAVTATYLVGTYARRVALHTDKERPKLIGLDEAWAITATDQGRSLIDETSRMGRSRNTVLVLASQSAEDLSDEKVRNCISTVIAHRIGTASEGAAVAKLLGVTPSAALTADLFSLRAGEAVMRDLDRRVCRMQVDVKWNPTIQRMLDHYVPPMQEVPA